MSIKLALLKTGDTIIADMKELVIEDKVQGYLLYLPHKISVTKSILITEEKKIRKWRYSSRGNVISLDATEF